MRLDCSPASGKSRSDADIVHWPAPVSEGVAGGVAVSAGGSVAAPGATGSGSVNSGVILLGGSGGGVVAGFQVNSLIAVIPLVPFRATRT